MQRPGGAWRDRRTAEEWQSTAGSRPLAVTLPSPHASTGHLPFPAYIIATSYEVIGEGFVSQHQTSGRHPLPPSRMRRMRRWCGRSRVMEHP